MTAFLPPHLLQLFKPAPPIPYLPHPEPASHDRKYPSKMGFGGISQYVPSWLGHDSRISIVLDRASRTVVFARCLLWLLLTTRAALRWHQLWWRQLWWHQL